MILFLYAISGLTFALGLFWRVRSTLDRAAGRPQQFRHWGMIFRIASLVLLCFLILRYKNGHLLQGLGIFFGTAVFVLLFCYFLFVTRKKE